MALDLRIAPGSTVWKFKFRVNGQGAPIKGGEAILSDLRRVDGEAVEDSVEAKEAVRYFLGQRYGVAPERIRITSAEEHIQLS